MICPHCNKPLTPEQVAGMLGSITRPAKKLSSAANGRKGGRPRSKNPSKNALYKREYRARLKEK